MRPKYFVLHQKSYVVITCITTKPKPNYIYLFGLICLFVNLFGLIEIMDCEKLITLVEERQSLWDQKSKQYHNRDLNKKLWREVAEIMKLSGKQTTKVFIY